MIRYLYKLSKTTLHQFDFPHLFNINSIPIIKQPKIDMNNLIKNKINSRNNTKEKIINNSLLNYQNNSVNSLESIRTSLSNKIKLLKNNKDKEDFTNYHKYINNVNIFLLINLD